MTAVLQLDVPNPAHGVYPERQDRAGPALDRLALALTGGLRRRVVPTGWRLRALARQVDGLAAAMAVLGDDALRRNLRDLAARVVRDLDKQGLAQALAIIREAARRSLGVTPYPTQIMGAAVLLSGKLAEMQTGEGKTLTAGLAACLAGAARLPVHVVTVNDYLAQRDSAEMGPLFAFFGLTVGTIVGGMNHADKRGAYACDIAYCTNKDLVFDYLRDRVAAGGRASYAQVRVRSLFGGAVEPLLLRGLHFAIVDEADSILIDEARTPLILSQQAGDPPDPRLFAQSLALAEGLEARRHFAIDAARRALTLHPAGQALLRDQAGALGGIFRSARARDHLVTQALRALHLYHRDQHYLVLEDKVQIVDEYTGRVLPGRTWEQGLHQMIEAKEGCPLSEPSHTLARITYQRFFRRYLRLSGMTGTAHEVAGELQRVYDLETLVLPTHRPCIRHHQPPVLCRDRDAQWRRVAQRVASMRAQGRPVLIGTRSVEASEEVSRHLDALGLPHRVLNARQDAGEAQIVAQTGQAGQVTVATNMAGRGTDIHLAPGVAASGGLHVILTALHDAARIDRQLFGRCARQGDPGSCSAILALTDPLFAAHGGWLVGLLAAGSRPLPGWPLQPLRRLCQQRAERIHARMRGDTLRRDRSLDDTLAFAGKPI